VVKNTAAQISKAWDGGGVNGNWVTANNWNDNIAPTTVGGDDYYITFDSLVSVQPIFNNTTTDGLLVSGLIFGENMDSTTIVDPNGIPASGDEYRRFNFLANPGSDINLMGDIIYNSGTSTTTGAALNFSGNLTFTTAAANINVVNQGAYVVPTGSSLQMSSIFNVQNGHTINFIQDATAADSTTLGGAINNNGTVYLTNNSTSIMLGSSIISGNGTLVVDGTGSGITRISGNNTYSGKTHLTKTNGAIELYGASSLGASGVGNETLIGENATVELRGAGFTTNEAIALATGARLTARDAETYNIAGTISSTSISSTPGNNTIQVNSGATLNLDVASGNAVEILAGGPLNLAVEGTLNLNDRLLVLHDPAANVIVSGSGVFNVNAKIELYSGALYVSGGMELNLNSVNAVDGYGVSLTDSVMNINQTNNISQVAAYNADVNINMNTILGNLTFGNATDATVSSNLNLAAGATLTLTGDFTHVADNDLNLQSLITGAGRLELAHTGELYNRFNIGESAAPGSQLVELLVTSELTGAGGIRKEGDGLMHLAGNNTYQGITYVTDGELMITGSTQGITQLSKGPSSISYAMITGNGSLGNDSSDYVHLTSLETFIAPGLSTLANPLGGEIGTLTLANADLIQGEGVFQMQLDAVSGLNDQINGIDTYFMSGIGHIEVVNGPSGGVYVNGQAFDLFDFNSVNIDSYIASGFSWLSAFDLASTGTTLITDQQVGNTGYADGTAYWDVSDFLNSGSITYRFAGIEPVVIPEPSKAIFLGLGAFAMLLRRRRK
jgi:autotransporter-associated beta strand protein